jgi:hypothetical protein
MRPPREDTKPWYRQFWPWFLISLPLSVVIASLVTINIALESDDGLVSDDYYKEGLAIHKNADSSARAKALGISGDISYDPETGAVTLRLDRPLAGPDSPLSLTATHPTLPDRDQAISLTPLGNATYAGRLEPMGPARWRLELSPEDRSWRIEGRLALSDRPTARLD